MTDNVTPLTTEHLRIMRDDIAQFRADITREVKEGFGDIRKRLARVEQSVLGLKRDEVEAATELAEHRLALDRLREIIDQLRERIDTLEAQAPH